MKAAKAIRGCIAHRFYNKDVPEEIAEEIVEADRWAPSPESSPPWRFIAGEKRNVYLYMELGADIC